MKTNTLSMSTLLLGLLGVAAGGLGCSDSSDDGTPNGSAGGPAGTAGSGVTGGQPGASGQPATAGTTGNSGGSPGSSGAPTSTGGTTTGSGGQGGAGTQAGNAQGGSAQAGSAQGGNAQAGNAQGGNAQGGSAQAGSSSAGTHAGGTRNGGAGSGGSAMGGAPSGGSGGGGGEFTGTCTASKGANKSVSGSGPHDVVIETNSENGIKCGTIYRPKDLGGAEKYPILVWGEGACSQNGLSDQAAMGEIASWGYFVVADGTPGGTNACQGGQNGKAFLDYITWAIAENSKPCSAYYQSLETTKIAADGFSCGGLMAENVSGDPRFTAIGITSSGLMAANDSLYDKMHAPFKIMNGGPSDQAHPNGLRDYDEIASRGIPIVYFEKTSAGHGGDLSQGRGDFTRVNLAWLNWQLKGDMGATGKGFLHGSTCQFCTSNGWVYKSANIP